MRCAFKILLIAVVLALAGPAAACNDPRVHPELLQSGHPVFGVDRGVGVDPFSALQARYANERDGGPRSEESAEKPQDSPPDLRDPP